MRVLVIGGTGFIGSHTVEALVSRGYVVTVLCRNSSTFPEHSPLHNSKIEFLTGDYRNSNVLSRALQKMDAVIHLAWIGFPHSTINLPASEIENNVIGTLTLLDQCVLNKIKKLIFISSGGTV